VLELRISKHSATDIYGHVLVCQSYFVADITLVVGMAAAFL